MINLTNRDVRLLEILKENDMLTYEQIGQLYNTSAYHYKRLKQLEKFKYTARKGRKYVVLGLKGIKELDLNTRTNWDIQKKLSEDDVGVKKREIAADLMLLSDKYNFQWYYSRTAKKHFNIDTNIGISGVINYQNKNYPVYVLPELPLKTKIKAIKKEISRLKIFSGVMVLCPTQESYNAFGDDACQVNSLYLLRYPNDLDLTFTLLNPEIIKNVHRSTLKINEVYPTTRIYADGLIKRNNKEYYLSNLLINDLVRYSCIKEYLDKLYTTEQRRIIVLHRENQNYCLSGEGVKTVAVSDSKLREIICSKTSV